MDDLDLMVPHRLDDVPRFFIWDFDVCLVWAGGLMFGIMIDQILLGLVVGFTCAWGVGKLKSGKHRGYGIHMLYWNTPMSMGLKRTPPSHDRDFLG